LLKSLLNVRAFIYRRPNGSTIDVVASSKALYQFLEIHCGMGAKSKRVPDFIFTAPSEMKWAFLKAYFIGDGCEHETKGKHKGFSYDFVTVSKGLALGVHYLLLQLGVNSRFSVKSRASVRDFGKYQSKTRLSYAVCYSKKSIVSAGGFRGGRGTGRKIGNLSLVKVTKVEQVQPSSEFVYDLEVKGYENFIGGIGMCLHNTGEGGAVLTNGPRLARIAQSVRDWGRDCRCTHESPPEGACGRRFEWHIPGLDEPYDHRYLYSEIGYNLKMTDIQAAIGLMQLDKLPDFIAARKRNFARLYEALERYQAFLALPVWSERADPAWFAFPVSVRPDAPFTRRDLTGWLEGRNIETRFLFAGNITRQPGYRHIQHRTVGDLPNSDLVMRSTFFVGVYPGLDDTRLTYMQEAFDDFFHSLTH